MNLSVSRGGDVRGLGEGRLWGRNHVSAVLTLKIPPKQKPHQTLNSSKQRDV